MLWDDVLGAGEAAGCADRDGTADAAGNAATGVDLRDNGCRGVSAEGA